MQKSQCSYRVTLRKFKNTYMYIYSGTPFLRSPMCPKQFAVLTRAFFYKKLYGDFGQAAKKKSGCNNEMTVLPRWP